MKFKTSELEGAALDWAVASLECDSGWLARHLHLLPTMPFSTDWSQAGQIIERERIVIEPTTSVFEAYVLVRENRQVSKGYAQHGPTPLIAAMRTFVASRLGDEVEIPEELL